MTDSTDAGGLSDELGAFDTLMHRGEAHPRTRTGTVGVEILDCTPDWDRFRRVFDYASRQVLRMRQKVVVPTLPTAAPRWVVDPDFNLEYHIRRLRLPEPATLRELLDLAELMIQSPLDVSRPLWNVTLVEGLANGQAGVLFHISHAVADGMGGVELFEQIYDLQRDPPDRPTPPLPVPQDLSPTDLMRTGISQLPGSIVGGVRDAVFGAARLIGRVVRAPATTITGAVEYARSTSRMINQAVEPSPLLRRRSLATRSEAIDVKLSDLHRAAKAAGGSVNDAYLAAVCGALRRYHETLGVPVATLPMSVPVNLRVEADSAGGNHFTGVTLAAPIGEPDPAVRILEIRAQMAQRREESAIDLMGSIAPVLSIMPSLLLDAMSSSVKLADVQASNVPAWPDETYIAGAKVLRHYGLGPLPGVAMMIVLISRAGLCGVAARYDRASVTDEPLFARCLQEGFDEVLELAGQPAPRSIPASFATGTETPDTV